MSASSEAVRSFFITLRRSYAGTPWQHRRILESLGLRKRMQTVEQPNSEAVRGMLIKVPHMVTVETDKMYYERKIQEHQQASLRPPIIVKHTSSTSK